MAGKSGEVKKTSLLRKMFEGDPDELKLAADATARVVPIHGIDDNVEAIIHTLTAQYQGRWVALPCGMDAHGECPFCADPREPLRVVTVKSVMLVWNLEKRKVQWFSLPKSIAKVLVAWETTARRPVKGREIILNRTGSGWKNTRYSASVLDSSTELPPWEEVKPEFERVLAKAEAMMTCPPLEELRRMHSQAQIKFQDGTTSTGGGGQREEAGQGWGSGSRHAVVEEEDW